MPETAHPDGVRKTKGPIARALNALRDPARYIPMNLGPQPEQTLRTTDGNPGAGSGSQWQPLIGYIQPSSFSVQDAFQTLYIFATLPWSFMVIA